MLSFVFRCGIIAEKLKDVINLNIIIDAIDVEDERVSSYEVQKPKKCPLCHCSFGGNYLSAHFVPHSDDCDYDVIYATYFCNNCSSCFSAEYVEMAYNTFKLTGTVPFYPERQKFSDYISKISPRFVEIYNEALQAESEGLNEICGLGYRKALEFLVKDYLVNLQPDNYEEIIKSPLGSVIKCKIDNNNIKILAERSAWLGNDETHYIRKHEEYNIQDLKKFLLATATYIDSELAVADALKIAPK